MSIEKSEEQLLKELEKIRDSGSINDVAKVFDMLRTYNEVSIVMASIRLLSDIKDGQIISILMEALRQPDNSTIRQHLLQACWESGLDYTNHLAYITDLFLSLDYLGALEAFTLIENTIVDHEVSELTKKEMVTKIRAVILDLPEHNQNLGLELIHLLEGR